MQFGGKGGKGVQKGRRPPSRNELEAALSNVMESMRTAGDIAIDHSSVVLRLCRKFDVDNLAMLGAAAHHFKDLLELKKTQVYVLTYLNCYRHEMIMGTLNDCIRSMLNDASSNGITLKQYDRFEDFGLGPICKQNEIVRIFPGAANITLGGTAPPFTLSHLVEAMAKTKNTIVKVALGDLDIAFEKSFGLSTTDACVYFEKRVEVGAGSQIPRVFRLLGSIRKTREDMLVQYERRELVRIRKHYESQVLNITREDLEKFEHSMAAEKANADGLLQYMVSFFPREWTNASNEKVGRKLAAYLRTCYPASPQILIDGVILALTIAIQKPSPNMCNKCNNQCDTCKTCVLPSIIAHRANLGCEEESCEVDLSDVIETINGVDLSSLTSTSMLGKLSEIENSCIAVLRAPSFDKLGHGSFLSFICENSSDISPEICSLMESGSAGAPVRTADLPRKSDLLKVMIEILQKKGAFVTSWRTLVDLRRDTLNHFEATNWSDVCDVSFEVFMMRNTSQFAEQGFQFMNTGLAKEEGNSVSKNSIEEAEATLAVFLDSISSTQTIVAEADLLRRQLAMPESDIKVLSNSNARASLRAKVGEDSISCGKGLMVFPSLTDLPKSFDTSNDTTQQSDPFDLLDEILSNPIGKDIETLMQWKDRYSDEHGPLDSFLIKNVKDSKRILVSPEGGEIKFYPTAQTDSEKLESAIISREFPGIAVQLWSQLAVVGDEDDGILESAMTQLSDMLVEKSRHDLIEIIIILMLSTPVSMVGQLFDFLMPILERVSKPVSRLWCDLGRSCSRHPQRNIIVDRVQQLDSSIKETWLEIMDRCKWDYPQYQQQTVTVTKTVTEVKQVSNQIPTQNEVVAETPVYDYDDDSDLSFEQKVINDIRKGRNFGVNSPVTSIVRKSVSVLSDELYENKFHFLFELLQNADDCSYSSTTVPCINISLSNKAIELLCNEVGFREKNVRAICDINQSTKTENDTSIGRKGIGFKAVFKITNCPHITSNGYDFYFDRYACDLGLILPIEWTEETQPPSTGKLVIPELGETLSDDEWTTRLHLPFRSELQNDEFLQECSDSALIVEPVLLLFLNKLRRVIINDKITSQYRILNRYDANDQLPESAPDLRRILLTEDTDGMRTEQEFVIYRKNHQVPEHIEIPSKDGANSTYFQVAYEIPQNVFELETLDLPIHPVTAYLPTNARVFRFVMQADWSVNAARDRIVEDSKWNKYLRTISAPHIIESLIQLKESNICPPQYLLAVLEMNNLQQKDWLRTVQVGIFEGLKRHPIIYVASMNKWMLPSDCIMIPTSLYEFVVNMIPQELLERISGQCFTDPYVFEMHKDVALRLGVKTLSAGLFLSIIEKVSSDSEASALLDDYNWLADMFYVLKVLFKDIRKNATGSESEPRLLERLRKVKCIPTQHGRLSSADNSIMLVRKEKGSNNSLSSYSFFSRFKMVDLEFVKICCRRSLTEAELGVILHNKLGVKATEPKVVLQLLESDIIASWKETPPSKHDAISAFMWVCRSFPREVRDAKRSPAIELLEQMPIVCKFSSDEDIPSYYDNVGLTCLDDDSEDVYLVNPSEVYVVQQGYNNWRNISHIAWLVPHSDYQNLNGLSIAGVFRDVGGMMVNKNVPLDNSVVDPKVLATFPAAQDAMYNIETDYVFPGFQILFEHLLDRNHAAEVLSEPNAGMNPVAKDLFAGVSAVIQMVFEVIHESHLESRVTYLPDFNKAEGFKGRVATEKDRRPSDSRFAVTTISRILKKSKWLMNQESKLLKPHEVILASHHNVKLVGKKEYFLLHPQIQEWTASNRGILPALGTPNELTTSRLIELLRQWQSGCYICSAVRMVEVLNVVGDEMKLIWMPEERGAILSPEMREPEVTGHWYTPDVCFIKGGTDAFLDLANGKHRFCGFVYLRCGYLLGGNGVKEHAPWDTQVLNVEDVARRYDKKNEIIDLLHQMSKYEDDIDENGWNALKTCKIWRATDGSYVSPSTVKLLVTDFKFDELTVLPDGFYVLDETLKAVRALAIKCGAQSFDDEAVTDINITPVDNAVDSSHLIRSSFLVFVWQVMMWQSELAVEGTVSRSAPPEATCGTIVVKPCNKISMDITLAGKRIHEGSSENDARDTYYDRKANTYYIAVANDHTIQHLVRSITKDICRLIELPEEIEPELQQHWKPLLKLHEDFLNEHPNDYFGFIQIMNKYFTENEFSDCGLNWFKPVAPETYFRTDVQHVVSKRSICNYDVYGWFSFMLSLNLLDSFLNVDDEKLIAIREVPLKPASKLTTELMHTETRIQKLNAHLTEIDNQLTMLYADECVVDGPECVATLTIAITAAIIKFCDIEVTETSESITNLVNTSLANANLSIPRIATDVERDVRQAIRVVGKHSQKPAEHLEKQLEGISLPEQFEVFFETTAQVLKKRQERMAEQRSKQLELQQQQEKQQQQRQQQQQQQQQQGTEKKGQRESQEVILPPKAEKPSAEAPREAPVFDPTAPNWGGSVTRNPNRDPDSKPTHSAETIQAKIDADANWPETDAPTVVRLDDRKPMSRNLNDDESSSSPAPVRPPSRNVIFIGGKYGGERSQSSASKVFKVSNEQTNNAVGKWGEEKVYSYLKSNPLVDNKGNEIRELHWVNQDSEQFYPFDIIAGCTVGELLQAVPSPKIDDYSNLLSQYPNFIAIEVKTSTLPERLDLEISSSELLAASRLRLRFSIFALSDVCNEPRLMKIPDPYTLIENNKLQLRLLIATDIDDTDTLVNASE